jgi:catechol 2,3-dioxygenase-like lactoylglutathione lyase family enzyme
MRVDGLDHLVLTVRDIGESCTFYERALRMSVVTFGEGRTALRFGNQKINLHEAGREFEPKALRPSPGSADLCFLVEGSLEDWCAWLASQNVPILEGPVRRTGARGPIQSIYLRDPDGNLIELSTPV